MVIIFSYFLFISSFISTPPPATHMAGVPLLLISSLLSCFLSSSSPHARVNIGPRRQIAATLANRAEA